MISPERRKQKKTDQISSTNHYAIEIVRVILQRRVHFYECCWCKHCLVLAGAPNSSNFMPRRTYCNLGMSIIKESG